MKLHFKHFAKEDFEEYKSWFGNAELNRFLGPMNDEWLSAVLTQTDGIEYAVSHEDELVAVVGVKLPDLYHTYYLITDLAVKPDMQRKGIGTEILTGLFKLHPLKVSETWRTFINMNNHKALAFFSKNGWVCDLAVPSRDGMLSFELV